MSPPPAQDRDDARATVSMLACDPATGREQSVPLPLERAESACDVRVTGLPGASSVQIALSVDGRMRLRVEVELAQGEDATVRITRGPEGLQVAGAGHGRKVFILPTDPDNRPPQVLLPPSDRRRLDLVFLIDGTMTLWEPGQSGAGERRFKFLLDQPEAWARRVRSMLEFATLLAEPFEDSRCMVLAFADRPVAATSAADLNTRYIVHPEPSHRRWLSPSDPELETTLAEIPASSGADFVDALAEALEECAALRWRGDARKLLFLYGESPGYSVVNPAPWGGNAGVRACDVETAGDLLHSLGVETISVFNKLPFGVGVAELREARALSEFAEFQYRRLASRPNEFSVLASAFDPEALAGLVLENTTPLARGSAYPVLMGVPEEPSMASPGESSGG